MTTNRALAIIATVAVAVTITAGIIVAGGPTVARQQRLDERRTQDLEQITFPINRYYTRHHTLPASLDALVADHEMPKLPGDPETRAPYRYSVTGATDYQLCATFEQPSPDDAFGGASWAHGTGPVCFRRTGVDTERH
jgi:hypothetical protein